MSVQAYLNDGTITNKTWRRALEDGVLLGKKCADCGHVTAAPKAACVRCGGRESEIVELPTTGEVFTSTTVHVAPVAFADDAPYDVALVDVGDARLMAHLSDPVEIGDSVELSGVVGQEKNIGPLFSRTTD